MAMGGFVYSAISSVLGILIVVSSFNFAAIAKNAGPRIAIVGAGIGGASTGFHLSQHFGRDAVIDVYERKQVGGRLATVRINNMDIESGGSIIHPRNSYMVNFTKLLNLRERERKAGQMSLFDGEEVVFSTSYFSVATMMKLFWRYGLSVVYLEDFINLLLKDFEIIYQRQNSGHAFTTPEKLVESMSSTMRELLDKPLRGYMEEREYEEVFIEELVTAAILTNYGQDTKVPSFVGAISLAGIQPGLWSVHGGNKQVPINLIERAKVQLRKATVTTVTANQDGSYIVTSTGNADKSPSEKEYDIVIIATPLEDNISGIKFVNIRDNLVSENLKYHRTVATFIHGQLKPGPFGFNSVNDIPKAVLATNSSLYYKSFGMQESVSYKLDDTKADERHAFGVWKVFSSRQLTKDELDTYFEDIKEVEVVDWLAYPEYTSMNIGDALPSFELSERLYYVNAFEWAASTMETQAIAGRNVALLAINRWENNAEFIDAQTFNSSKKRDRGGEL